jgi:hypothetical protein
VAEVETLSGDGVLADNRREICGWGMYDGARQRHQHHGGAVLLGAYLASLVVQEAGAYADVRRFDDREGEQERDRYTAAAGSALP